MAMIQCTCVYTNATVATIAVPNHKGSTLYGNGNGKRVDWEHHAYNGKLKILLEVKTHLKIQSFIFRI
jgi:hypothetical protein